jgi:hypothetical protein
MFKMKICHFVHLVRDAKYFLLFHIDVTLVERQHFGVENLYEIVLIIDPIRADDRTIQSPPRQVKGNSGSGRK